MTLVVVIILNMLMMRSMTKMTISMMITSIGDGEDDRDDMQGMNAKMFRDGGEFNDGDRHGYDDDLYDVEMCWQKRAT